MYNEDLIYGVIYVLLVIGVVWTLSNIWWKVIYKKRDVTTNILSALMPTLVMMLILMVTGPLLLVDFGEDKREKMYESQELKNIEYVEEDNKYYVEGVPLRTDIVGIEDESGDEKGKYKEVEYELKEGYSTLLYENKYKKKTIYK